MKLVSYQELGDARAGVLWQDLIFDLEGLAIGSDWANLGAVNTVRGFLERYGSRLAEISADVESRVSQDHRALIGTRSAVRLVSPVPNPAKVLCVGLNYKDHVAETGRELPQYPDVFAKFASSLIGPDDEIGGARISSNLDFEGELAVVIGRSAREVSEAEALSYVAGVAPLNDITARDLQYRGTQWLAGKAVDGATPWGPALVTLDEIEDVQALELATRVNGVEMQRSNTRHQIFSVARIIAYLSSFLSLEPGDVIATGTPQGIGAKRTPPIWLQPGDLVEIDIDGVGLLSNRVAAP